jgi:hypothetical protein
MTPLISAVNYLTMQEPEPTKKGRPESRPDAPELRFCAQDAAFNSLKYG